MTRGEEPVILQIQQFGNLLQCQTHPQLQILKNPRPVRRQLLIHHPLADNPLQIVKIMVDPHALSRSHYDLQRLLSLFAFYHWGDAEFDHVEHADRTGGDAFFLRDLPGEGFLIDAATARWRGSIPNAAARAAKLSRMAALFSLIQSPKCIRVFRHLPAKLTTRFVIFFTVGEQPILSLGVTLAKLL